KAKYGRETDSEQVPRGKDEKDFEKRVKECLKLPGGKRMGAGDAPRSDAERRLAGPPVRRSARGADRCGLHRRPKPGRIVRSRGIPSSGRGHDARHRRARGAHARPRHRPVGSPSDPS
ncbi:unnamed protein product, partial [Musa hybrid cultivar]